MDLEELGAGSSLSPLRLTLIVLLLLLSYKPAEGQFHVIGSLQPVVAAPGDDVLLPCHVEPQVNVAKLTVEWSRPDIKPDPNDRLKRVDYVHLYRNTREVLDMKISSYLGRTTLFAEGLKHGNISLRITNVTAADQGRYKCFIPKLRSEMSSSIVQLVVASNNAKTPTTETPLHPGSPPTRDPTKETIVKGNLLGAVVFVLILLVGVTAGLCVWQKHKRHRCTKVPAI